MHGLLAVLVVEREPTQWRDLAAAARGWLEVGGGFALFALGVFFLYRWLNLFLKATIRGFAPAPMAPVPIAVSRLFSLALAAYLGYGLVELFAWMSPSPTRAPALAKVQNYLLTMGGSCALLAAITPPLLNLTRLRWRRIWALARLSFKEAIHRNKVYWAPTAFVLIFLFAGWFIPYKADDPVSQVRTFVRVIYWALTPLLLFTAVLLAAFSIPADLKQQTMYTIVTKPVERFEIVLGRCLGYIILMTLVLGVLTSMSLVYVARGIDKEAADECYKARVPIFGELEVLNAQSVGREWAYRRYISGGVNDQRAIWTFSSVPADFAGREQATTPCEFYFDIFRTHKGRENRGVRCSFAFENWQWDVTKQNDYAEDRGWVLDHQSAELSDAEVRSEAERDRWPAEKAQRRLAIAQELRPIIATE